MECVLCHNSHGPDESCDTFIRQAGEPASSPSATRVLQGGPAPSSPPRRPGPPVGPTPAPVFSNSGPGVAQPAPYTPSPLSPSGLHQRAPYAPNALSPSGLHQPTPAQGPMGPPSGVVDPLIGATIGTFRVVRQLGTGGMGTVYLGEQTFIGSKVAIKVLHEHLASNVSLVQRFYSEARAVNVIGHENIVSIIDLNIIPPNRYYLVMEFLEGEPLSDFARGPLTPDVYIPILGQVCDALDAAHAHSVVHRDLKPDNIFLTKRGRNAHFVKVLDFGIAKLFDTQLAGERTAAGIIMGTPDYMAPEQTAGSDVDGRTDVYALGVIAYQLATGKVPFSGANVADLLIAHRMQPPTPPHVVHPAVSKALSDAIVLALAKEPKDRYQSAGDFRRALEAAFGAPEPKPIKPVTPAPALFSTPTPAPLESRYEASFEANLLGPKGVARTLRCTDISRGGMFLHDTEALPALFSRHQMELLLPDGPLALTAEVIRHVNKEQSKAWNMPVGFAVQFVEVSPQTKETLQALVKGLPRVKPEPLPKDEKDDPEVEALLNTYKKRLAGSHYDLLGLPDDAEFSDIRERIRIARRRFAEFLAKPLSKRQRDQLAALDQRMGEAFDSVGQARGRLEYDAGRSNWKGVARSIAAGTSLSEVELVRKKHLSAKGVQVGNGQLHYTTAVAWENQGEVAKALESYERALTCDPLNVTFHQKYWAALKIRGGRKP